jgi:hypothetical protein
MGKTTKKKSWEIRTKERKKCTLGKELKGEGVMGKTARKKEGQNGKRNTNRRRN